MGKSIAEEILNSGRAWKKFLAICQAQGGLFELPKSRYHHTVTSHKKGKITAINNRHLASLAKLAGAPHAKAAGLEMHVHLNEVVEKDQPLFTIHAEVPGELKYAVSALSAYKETITLDGVNGKLF